MGKPPISTYALLAVNILVFGWLAFQQQSLMMNRNVDVLAILHAGANLNPFTLGGEPWRVITSMFLHFGIIHLAVNMYALYSLGVALEPAVSTPRFLLVYFFCGVASGLASLVFNVYQISAGASGALFGLYGYRLGAEAIHSLNDRRQLGTVALNFFIFVVINAFISAQINVDLPGHIGGCVAGLSLAILHFKVRWLIPNKYLSLALIILSLSLFLLPLDQLRYYRIFQQVIKVQDRNNVLYDQNLSDAQLVDSLKSISAQWHSIHGAIHTLKRIPEVLQHDTAVLRKYALLQSRKITYRVSMIERESFVYLDSLEIINGEIDSIPRLVYILNYNAADEPVEPDTLEAKQSSARETKRVFYDASWKEADDASNAVYYRIGTVDSLGRWQGALRDYYRDGTIQMKGAYADNMKEGVFLYYSNHGTYTSAGRYVKEESVGKWETYHWDGVLKSEVYYNDKTFTRNVWDSLGRPQVVNGEGKSIAWYANGQISEEGNYKGGRREGDWLGYYNDGRPYFREFYRDNKLVRGVSVDMKGKQYVYDEQSFYPVPVTGMPAYQQYLAKNKRLPDLFNRAAGSVKVLFNVGDDGSVWDFVILRSLSSYYDQEAIRLIKDGPAWRPGLLHGHTSVPSQGYIEVVF